MFLACHDRFMPLRNVQGMFALLMLHCIRLLTLYASKRFYKSQATPIEMVSVTIVLIVSLHDNYPITLPYLYL